MKESISLEFLKRSERTPDRPAIKIRRNHAWITVSWGDMRKLAEQVFHYLTRRMGLASGDKVSILSENSLEWFYCDQAVMAAGATSVCIYPTNTAKQAAYIVSHSDSVGVFVSTRQQGEKILENLAQLPLLEWIIVMNEEETLEHPKAVHLARVLHDGAALMASAPEKFSGTIRSLDDSLICTYIYTSGTTGPPKGVMLSHKSCLAAARAILDISPATDQDHGISYLPMCHSYARTCETFCSILLGTWGAIVTNMDNLMKYIKEINPTLFNSVPRLYEKMYHGIHAKVAEAPKAHQDLFQWAVETGKEYVRVKYEEGVEPDAELEANYRKADQMVFSLIRREVFGGDMNFVGTGGAPIPPEIVRFFHAMGIRVLEGYGLTETAAVAACNRPEPGGIRFGTIGKPLKGIEIKTAEDGELLIRGNVVMDGYFKQPEATAEAIRDGWFHTGDLGFIDEDGFIRITGRKKEIIITAGGKNITPANIEAEMKANVFIDEFVAYGDRRKFLTGLLVPDFPALEKWAGDNGIAFQDREDLIACDKVRAMLKQQVRAVNQSLPSYETIKDVVILARGFRIQEDELTPTNKVKRRNVYRKYMDQLDALYPKEGLTGLHV